MSVSEREERITRDERPPTLRAIGVDLVDIGRLQVIYRRRGEAFLIRLFTGQERLACQGVSGYRWRSLAGRFAAKEAVKKILAIHGQVAGWTEIEILNGPHGEPRLELHGRAQAALQRSGYAGLKLSIAHDAGLAVAVAIAL
ncbi:MAG: holo-ACP synthase [Ktedonobacteraceae bacterium]|nr:holo-ACP synthase [Ktedonobacteraceae bacterium]